MKAIQSLSAVMLLGAVSIAAGFDVAVAKQRHHVSNDSSQDGSHGIISFKRAQKLGGENPTTAPLTSDAAGSKVNQDRAKGNQNAGAPISSGLMKKDDVSPAKAGPRDAGTVETGKNHVGDHEDSGHHDNAVNRGKGNGTDVGKSDIIADGPGHKTTKSSDTKKKITTIFRPHEVRDHQHPSVTGKVERNAIGVAIPNGGNPKLGLDPKVSAKLNGAPAGLGGPTAAKTIPNAVMPFARRPRNNALQIAPKTGPMISGTSVSRSGSNLTSVGGPSKNIVGALSGSSFKPKHP